MRWFRSHVRFGAYLALFALTVQFAVSFSNVHVGAAGLKAADSNLVALLGAQAASDTATVPAKPLKPHPNGLAGDNCAICTLIQMAGTSPPTVAVELPLPIVVDGVTLHISVGQALHATPHALAQARAPPIA